MLRNQPLTVSLIGAGFRGQIYTDYAHKRPEELRVVAVAEPDELRRRKIQEKFGLPQERCFASWEELLVQPRLSDAAMVCTQDRHHYAPALEALRAGYHVLLEKPMSPDWRECVELGKQAEQSERLLTICHVLRYSPFFQTIKGLLDEGRIGRLMAMQHNENVGYWHQAHSYVRGNWRSSEQSSPMILAKSCHDMDIMQWLVGGECESVASYGSLTHFRPESAPEGAPLRCLDGCPAADDCVYYAPNIYLHADYGWKQAASSPVNSYEARYQALVDGPYGRCVYHCDNDVVDHQVVSMSFNNDVTAVFTMSAFTEESSRTLKLMGTKGEIRASMETNQIELRLFGSGKREIIELTDAGGHVGHGGGDLRLVRDFVRAARSFGQYDSATSARASIQSHLMAFAAERSRVEGRMVALSEFQQDEQVQS